MVEDWRVFGFGSLVNPATHEFEIEEALTLPDSVREWVTAPMHDQAFLSLADADGHAVAGVIMRVPPSHHDSLDAREAGYSRHDLSDGVITYRARPEPRDTAKPILMSYLDVVIQGFLEQLGEDAAQGFFTSTRNWDHPVLNDRENPRYPRFQTMSDGQADFVDQGLAAVGARIVTAL